MIKIIVEKDYEQLETEVNIFEHSHEVLDIQINTHLDTWYAVITYKETYDNYSKLKQMDIDELAQFFYDYTHSIYTQSKRENVCMIDDLEYYKDWLREEL